MYNELFKACVKLLRNWAAYLHMTYEEINIWIFCVIEPIVFIVMVITIVRLSRQNKQLTKYINKYIL